MADRAGEQDKALFEKDRALCEVAEGQVPENGVLVVVRMASRPEISGHRVELVVGETQPRFQNTRTGDTYDEDGDVVMTV